MKTLVSQQPFLQLSNTQALDQKNEDFSHFPTTSTFAILTYVGYYIHSTLTLSGLFSCLCPCDLSYILLSSDLVVNQYKLILTQVYKLLRTCENFF